MTVLNLVLGGTIFTEEGHYSPVNNVRGDIFRGDTVHYDTGLTLKITRPVFAHACCYTSCMYMVNDIRALPRSLQCEELLQFDWLKRLTLMQLQPEVART